MPAQIGRKVRRGERLVEVVVQRQSTLVKTLDLPVAFVDDDYGTGKIQQALRQVGGGVVHRLVALSVVRRIETEPVVVAYLQVHVLDLGLDVHVDVADVKVELARLLPALSRPTVLKVEARQVFQQLVERLLLVLVGLTKAQHLVRAELAYAVALEDVVLADPVELAGRVVAHSLHLQNTRHKLVEICVTVQFTVRI